MKNMEKYLNKFYDFIDKIGKHNFILIIFVFIVLLVTGLYQTFSLYTESGGLSILDGLDTYSFILDASNKSNSVIMTAGTKKNIDITIKNDSDVPLKYGLYSSKYSDSDTNFIFGYSTNTEQLPNGIIPAKTNYVVTLKVYNYSSENQTINFGVQYGFENAELTLNSGQHWIEPLYLMKNLFNSWDGDYNYYRADEYRDKIVSISFVDLDTIKPLAGIENAIMSWNISATNENDESVKAWLIYSDYYSGYYDLYIGSSGMIYAESLYGLFSQMSELKIVAFVNLDTSLVTDMSFLFRDCTKLYWGLNFELDLSNFDTSNVTNMWSMFGGCSSLTNLNISNFDTIKVTNMQSMFLNCSGLVNLDLSSFNTENVTNMIQMFQNCSSLISDDISTNNVVEGLVLGNGFVTDNVTSMANMFQNCSNLTKLDVSRFDTSRVINMIAMFSGCSSLTELDLSNFDIRNVTDMRSMFSLCEKLTTSIIIRDIATVISTYNGMFYGAATDDDAQILVYYDVNTEELVKNMVATKSDTSNVFAVLSRLADRTIGDYVKYVGVGVDENKCDDTTTVNGWTSCGGMNANYTSDTSMGYCVSTERQFNVNGWRIGYIEDGSAHLVSAGATDCMCTDSSGNFSLSNSNCSTSLIADDIGKHLKNMDTVALRYCNTDYAKGGKCDDTTAWAMDAVDFQKITNSPLSDTSCYNSSEDETCGYNNNLIDNGGWYWYATSSNIEGKKHAIFDWDPNNHYVAYYNSSVVNGVRPVLVLDSSVYVTGGKGTYNDPYIISSLN